MRPQGQLHSLLGSLARLDQGNPRRSPAFSEVVMPLESGAQGQGPTDTKAKAPQAADRRLTDGAHIVDFDGDDDPANPLNWSRGRKWAIVSCLSAVLTVACVYVDLRRPQEHQA